MSRLQDFYRDTVAGQLKEKFGYANIMQVPRLRKITVNMGLGEAVA
ncbi:MAG: 50S ribosomal protein L5, partial [Wenzhouxiangellaceae bacterium]